eukprot:1201216-Amorphochlora_amoeboformis.AAC.1
MIFTTSRGGFKIAELLDAVYYYPNPVSRFKDASSPFSSGHRGHRALLFASPQLTLGLASE